MRSGRVSGPRDLPRQGIEEGEVRKAIEKFAECFGSEAIVELVSIEGRVLEVKFSGHMCYTCGTSDYFDDFTLVLEEVSDSPYTVWDYDWIESYFLVKIAKLDFLDEIEGAMEEAGDLVKKRIQEFERVGGGEDSLFKELCFCILTANFKAEEGMRIQEALGDDFLKLKEDKLVERLRQLGYRFPRTRARYIIEARRFYGKLAETLAGFKAAEETREWLVENVMGLGYKEASHFLRNVGIKDVAIIDRHILRFLEEKELMKEVPKSLNRAKYIKLEKLLSAIANKLGLSLGELDLYIWFTRTGKVLK